MAQNKTCNGENNYCYSVLAKGNKFTAWQNSRDENLNSGVKVQGPVSRKSRKLLGPEKTFVKLGPAESLKLFFSYVLKGIKIKVTAKFRASRRVSFEDTRRIVSPEMRPKSFGTFEKQAPGVPSLTKTLGWLLKKQSIKNDGKSQSRILHQFNWCSKSRCYLLETTEKDNKRKAGMSIVPCISQEHEHSVEGCKPPDQWKIARVSAPFKKGREEDRTSFA